MILDAAEVTELLAEELGFIPRFRFIGTGQMF
jgi:hypothetical protein